MGHPGYSGAKTAACMARPGLQSAEAGAMLAAFL
jgi:hypothetical protein